MCGYTSGQINEVVVTAFDIMLNFLDYLIGCEVGIEPVILRFYINPNGNSEREINIMLVEIGKEILAMHPVEQYAVNIAGDADEVSIRLMDVLDTE